MFIVGQLVTVRRTGAYGVVVALHYSTTVEVKLDTGRTVRFDRSSLDVVPRGTKVTVTL